MSKMYYFAYGSNMDISQMKRRCPMAKPIRPLMIKGWKLIFRSVADITPAGKDNVVRGALWEITEQCEQSLDRYEGWRPDETGLYRKIYFKTSTVDGPVMAYVMNSDEHLAPADLYLETIMRGYKDFGYNPQIVRKIAKRSPKRNFQGHIRIESNRKKDRKPQSLGR